MKIGILGAGNVGGQLARGWIRHGHRIMLSSRDPNSLKMQALVAELGAGAQVGTVEETVAFGDVIVVAIPWDVLPNILRAVGGWSGKVVIDATNRFGAPPSDSVGSAAQDIAYLTGASVVKAFNTIGAEHMDGRSDFGGQQPTMFIAGDNADSKETVRVLAEQLGFDVVDVGGLHLASLLEDLTRLWIALARGGYGRNIAFKLLQG